MTTKYDLLNDMIGERVTFFCMNYIYTGKLEAVSEACAMLTEASIVYETGALTTKDWTDAQALPHNWYVQMSSIESFGKLK